MSDYIEEPREKGFKGYPVYKLLRAVNRQYPNNGFINYVDVREDMYDNFKTQMIDEDLRDLINETLQEVYINVAIDEVYSFPTVPGQKEYALPEDCDLRDIQEVTRTFRGPRGPIAPPPMPHGDKPTFSLTFYANGGTGEMPPLEAEIGDTIVLPECSFEAPDGLEFKCWIIESRECMPGDEVAMYADLTVMPEWWEGVQYTVSMFIATLGGTGILHHQRIGEAESTTEMSYGDDPFTFEVTAGDKIGDVFSVLELHDEDDNLLVSYLNFTPTSDTEIPMAVPIVSQGQGNSETPADNGDGGNGGNPLDGGSGSTNPETPADDDDGGYGDNPL